MFEIFMFIWFIGAFVAVFVALNSDLVGRMMQRSMEPGSPTTANSMAFAVLCMGSWITVFSFMIIKIKQNRRASA